MRDAILFGALSVGQRLPEVELSRQFQVSRAAIRESLQLLEHEGLVVLNSHRGAQVIDLSSDEIDEVIHVRLLLEPEAVRLATKRVTVSEKADLRKAAERLESLRQNPQEFVRLDRAFHELIWSLSGNATLQRQLTLLTAPLFSLGTILRRSGAIAGSMAKPSVFGDHRNLARVIAEGPDKTAMEAIREHITENWSRTKAAVGQLHESRTPRRKAAR